jgi:hypothetical protein
MLSKHLWQLRVRRHSLLIVYHDLKREARIAPVDGAAVDKYCDVITSHSTHHNTEQSISLNRRPAESLITMIMTAT